MVSLRGFEPPTCSLEGYCSIQLSYRLMLAGIAGLEPAHTGVKVLCLTDLTISQYWRPQRDSNP